MHLLKGDEFEKPVPVNELAIDIGADTREQAETLVQIGDNACFVPFFERVHGTVKAKALDDRVGCFALITLMQRPLEYDTYFVFSTQEEIACAARARRRIFWSPMRRLCWRARRRAIFPA